MDQLIDKNKFKMNMCTYRRLNIQHEINENLCKQNHLSNLHFYKYQEELFYRKIDHLKKSLQHIQPYINNEESLMISNCSIRIKNHFRLLNFSSQTEKRLLYNKSNYLPNILQKQTSNKINQYLKDESLLNQSDLSTNNHHFLNLNSLEGNYFQSYRNQQIYDEYKKQMNNDERKIFLLKQFDELKHTINDPHSTFSVLAALS